MNKKLITKYTLAAMLLSNMSYGVVNIYVAHNGNDSNSGTISSPLKTLLGARNKVRSVNKSDGVNVYFRGGTYPVTSTVRLRFK